MPLFLTEIVQETGNDLETNAVSTHNATWWNMTRLIPIQPYPCHSIAPEVPFSSAIAYDQAIERFFQRYTKLLRDSVAAWMSFPSGHSRLVWTRRDLILSGLADFDELQEEGLCIVRDVTQDKGYAWCRHTNNEFLNVISCAARSYTRAYTTNYIWNEEEDIKLFSSSLQEELVTTLYENKRFFDALFQANFVLWHDSRSRLCNVLSRQEAVQMVVAFLMGTNSRLGEKSVVNTLKPDILYFLLNPLLLHDTLKESKYGQKD